MNCSFNTAYNYYQETCTGILKQILSSNFLCAKKKTFGFKQPLYVDFQTYQFNVTSFISHRSLCFSFEYKNFFNKFPNDILHHFFPIDFKYFVSISILRQCSGFDGNARIYGNVYSQNCNDT